MLQYARAAMHHIPSKSARLSDSRLVIAVYSSAVPGQSTSGQSSQWAGYQQQLQGTGQCRHNQQEWFVCAGELLVIVPLPLSVSWLVEQNWLHSYLSQNKKEARHQTLYTRQALSPCLTWAKWAQALTHSTTPWFSEEPLQGKWTSEQGTWVFKNRERFVDCGDIKQCLQGYEWELCPSSLFQTFVLQAKVEAGLAKGAFFQNQAVLKACNKLAGVKAMWNVKIFGSIFRLTADTFWQVPLLWIELGTISPSQVGVGGRYHHSCINTWHWCKKSSLHVNGEHPSLYTDVRTGAC